MGFKFERGKNRAEKTLVVSHRVTKKDLLDAYLRAKEDTGLTTSELMDQIMRYCLTETGYLARKEEGEE